MEAFSALVAGQTLAHLPNREQTLLAGIANRLDYLYRERDESGVEWATLSNLFGPARSVSDPELAQLDASLQKVVLHQAHLQAHCGRPESPLTVAPGDPSGGGMDIHKPKPWRGWPEFLKEIGTIVIGVLIALAGEQTVEALTWRHKVSEAETALRHELAANLSYAAEQQALGSCANRYIDVLQQAIAANRPETIAALYKLGPPTHPHPWRIDTWTAALNAQVPDHMSPERVQAYSLAARFVNSEESQQWELVDLYSQVMAGRFGRLADAGAASADLVTVDRLRANEARRADITEAFLTTSRESLGVRPSSERADEFRKVISECEAKLRSLPSA